MPTTDCDCYNELINMKETFKRKCFGKTSAGLYKLMLSAMRSKSVNIFHICIFYFIFYILHISVIKLEREMNQKWGVCRSAFSRCKKQQDAALAFVSKCKTSTTGFKEQYKQLVVVSNSIDSVMDKIDSVLQASQAAAEQLNRGSLLIVTCPVFTSDVTVFINLVQVIQGSRLGRSVTDLLALVDRIIYVTIYPACDASEMTSLTSAQEVVAVVQATVAQQIQQIQQILSHVEEETVVPEDVGITQAKLHNLYQKQTFSLAGRDKHHTAGCPAARSESGRPR